MIVGLLPPCFKEHIALGKAALYICPIIFCTIVRSKTRNAIRMHHWVISYTQCQYLSWWDDKSWLLMKWEVKFHSLEKGLLRLCSLNKYFLRLPQKNRYKVGREKSRNIAKETLFCYLKVLSSLKAQLFIIKVVASPKVGRNEQLCTYRKTFLLLM